MSKLIKVRKRRRRKAGTNYKKRKELIKSEIPRLVVRKSNKYILAQVITSKEAQDKIEVGVNSKELLKLGWKFGLKNIPAAYLTGLLLGKKAKKFEQAIVDIGLYRPIKNSRLFAVVKGCTDAGMHINQNIEFDENRIKGLHINKEIEGKLNEIKNKILQ